MSLALRCLHSHLRLGIFLFRATMIKSSWLNLCLIWGNRRHLLAFLCDLSKLIIACLINLSLVSFRLRTVFLAPINDIKRLHAVNFIRCAHAPKEKLGSSLKHVLWFLRRNRLTLVWLVVPRRSANTAAWRSARLKIGTSPSLFTTSTNQIAHIGVFAADTCTPCRARPSILEAFAVVLEASRLLAVAATSRSQAAAEATCRHVLSRRGREVYFCFQ